MKELQLILDISRRDFSENYKMDYLGKELNENSYFKKAEINYVTELNYKTPVELKDELNLMWQSEKNIKELVNVITVAAFKLKDSEQKIDDTLKETIYNF